MQVEGGLGVLRGFWALGPRGTGFVSIGAPLRPLCTDDGIANVFCNHFKRAYSGSDSPAHESLKASFQVRFDEYYRSHCLESIGPYYLSWSDMLEVMAVVKIGKSMVVISWFSIFSSFSTA